MSTNNNQFPNMPYYKAPEITEYILQFDDISDIDLKKEYTINDYSIIKIDKDFNRITIKSDAISIGDDVSIKDKYNHNEIITKKVKDIKIDNKHDSVFEEVDLINTPIQNSFDDIANNRQEGIPDPTEEDIDELSINVSKAYYENKGIDSILGML